MANAQRTELWWQMVEEEIKRLREVGMQEWDILCLVSSTGGPRGHSTHEGHRNVPVKRHQHY